MRTFRIEKPSATGGSATFWVMVAGNGVKESNLAERTLDLSNLGPQLNRLKMPDALPPRSRAHLFREGTLNCSPATDNCELVLGTQAIDIDATYP
jgi:hypothetical protein